MTKQKLLMKMMTKVQEGKVLGMLFSAQMLESTKVIISCTSMATLGKWQNMKLEMITRKITANLSSAFRLFSLALSTILGEPGGFFCLKKQWHSVLQTKRQLIWRWSAGKAAEWKMIVWIILPQGNFFRLFQFLVRFRTQKFTWCGNECLFSALLGNINLQNLQIILRNQIMSSKWVASAI